MFAVVPLAEQIDTIREANGWKSDLAVANALGVKGGRQTVGKWRKADRIGGANGKRLQKMYQEAVQALRGDGRSEEDWRRRAQSALGLLEGDSLRKAAEALVGLALSQEIAPHEQGASEALAIDAVARIGLQKNGGSQAAGA